MVVVKELKLKDIPTIPRATVILHHAHARPHGADP